MVSGTRRSSTNLSSRIHSSLDTKDKVSTVSPCAETPAERYHRFTFLFESPTEESLVFNVDCSEDPEAIGEGVLQ